MHACRPSSINIAAVLTAIIAVSSTSAEAGNIALNAAIIDGTADFNADFVKANVFDGAVRDIHSASGLGAAATSYFLSPDGGGSTAYFVADLGSSQQVGEIILRPSSNERFDDRGTLNFQVRGSNSLAAITGAAPSALVILSSNLPDVLGSLNPPVTTNDLAVHPAVKFNATNGLATGAYRYLRFESLSAVGNHAALGEMIVSPDADNLALGASIIDGSGSWNGGVAGVGSPFNSHVFASAHVTDGSTSDFAVGGGEKDYWLGREQTNNEWFKLDLGLAQAISRIELVNTHNDASNDRGTANFNIQYSTDDVTYFPLISGTLTNASGTGTNLPVDSFSFGSVDARYLRFEAETIVGQSAGLNEILVFIPEPGSAALLGLASMVFALRRRRR